MERNVAPSTQAQALNALVSSVPWGKASVPWAEASVPWAEETYPRAHFAWPATTADLTKREMTSPAELRTSGSPFTVITDRSVITPQTRPVG